MALSESQVEGILKDLVKQEGLTINIAAVVYREDYQDYLVVVGDVHYTDIREKLINDYCGTKHVDFRNQILFKLKNPYELDEFQKEELGLSGPPQAAGDDGKGIELDNSADTDWV